MNDYNYAKEILKEYDQSNSQDNYKRIFISGYEMQDDFIVVTKVENCITQGNVPEFVDSIIILNNQK